MKKNKITPFFIFLLASLLFSVTTYSQQFTRLSNIENLFNLSKKQIDSTLLANGYVLKSKDLKTKILTYKKSLSLNNYNYTVNVLYKGDKLNSFLWDDYTEFAYFIIKDSSNDYKFNNEKTNDELGIFYVESKELDLDLMIFKTLANTQKGKIAFRIFKREQLNKR